MLHCRKLATVHKIICVCCVLLVLDKPTPIPDAQPAPHNDDFAAELAAALSDVKQKLWTDLTQYVKKINQASEASDVESIARLGHTIKGFGGNLQHPRITELGKAIQLVHTFAAMLLISICRRLLIASSPKSSG